MRRGPRATRVHNLFPNSNMFLIFNTSSDFADLACWANNMFPTWEDLFFHLANYKNYKICYGRHYLIYNVVLIFHRHATCFQNLMFNLTPWSKLQTQKHTSLQAEQWPSRWPSTTSSDWVLTLTWCCLVVKRFTEPSLHCFTWREFLQCGE